MPLGSFKIRWAPAAEWIAGALLELVGLLPRETCGGCAKRLGPTANFCDKCGTRRGAS